MSWQQILLIEDVKIILYCQKNEFSDSQLEKTEEIKKILFEINKLSPDILVFIEEG